MPHLLCVQNIQTLIIAAAIRRLGWKSVAVLREGWGKAFVDQLLTLKSGEAIHEVHAQAAPDAPRVHIADVVLTSAPVTSNFADRQLFFRHGQMLDDLEDHPDWASAHAIYGPPGFFSVCPAVAGHTAYKDVCAHAGESRPAQLEEAATQKARAEEATESLAKQQQQ